MEAASNDDGPARDRITLKDPAKNGKRSLEEITTHMGTDKLVLWGWDPGDGRTRSG